MRRRDMRPYSLSGVLLSNQVSYFTKLLVVESVDTTNGISINLRSYSLSGVLLSNQASYLTKLLVVESVDATNGIAKIRGGSL